MRISLPPLLLLLLLATALVACGPTRRTSTPDDDDDDSVDDDDAATDDDDAADDDDDGADDDDATDDDDIAAGPYEGDWTGTVIGEVRFDAVEYACGGEVTVHIDDLNRVTGIVDCPITGNETQNCGFDLPEVGLVLDGPSVQHVVDCTGADWPGSVAIVTDTFVQGVVQGVAFVDSLGIEVEVDFTYSIFR